MCSSLAFIDFTFPALDAGVVSLWTAEHGIDNVQITARQLPSGDVLIREQHVDIDDADHCSTQESVIKYFALPQLVQYISNILAGGE